MPTVPVPSSFDRAALRREANAKLQRFLAEASASTPEDGKEINKNFRTMSRTISGLAGQRTALHAVHGDGRVPIGDAAAVCFLGSQDVIILRIYFRTGQNTWLEYEYAFCEERGSRKWTNARRFYQSLARQQSSAAPPIDIDMSKVRSSAEELLVRITTGIRGLRFKGALLTGVQVEEQIKGLRPTFTLGMDAREASVDSLRAACFVSEANGLSLRVFQRGARGWQHATFVLDVSHSRPTAQHRGRRGGDVTYRWR